MTASTEHPKVFISYSWTNAEHEQFVLDLAIALRGHGVDAVLDKWDLKPGQDKFVFMESMVVDPEVSRVLVVCDRKYQEKADARAGGVGTESQIISQEVYGKVKQTKFIPIVREYDEHGHPCLPVFMKGLIFIDMSSDERYGEGLDQLLRMVYEQPFHQKPQLGSAPAFVTSEGASYVRELGSALRAIQDGKPNRQGLETQFIRSLWIELNKLYSEPKGDDYDEGVYQGIAQTKPLRDQLAQYLDTVALFSNDDPVSVSPFIKLMEELGQHFGPPANQSHFYPGWANFYAFFAHEAMLTQTAALLRHSRWKSLNRLTSAAYLIRNSNGEQKAASFVAFETPLVALDEHRNRRLKLNRVSLSTDMLRERCSEETVSFAELMQADVFLTLRSVVDLAAQPANSWFSYWAPKTSIFAQHGNKHPVFMKAIEADSKIGLSIALGTSSVAELSTRLKEANQRAGGLGRLVSKDSFSDFNLPEAINFAELTK